MTESDNTGIEPREDTEFTFRRIRPDEPDLLFYPAAGARLSFASKAPDTLTLPGLPAGLLAKGDKVAVDRVDLTVFVGEVDEIATAWGRGSDSSCTATVQGPWRNMQRMVFRQVWYTGSASGAWGTSSTARCILNQTVDGSNQSLHDTAAEILSYGAEACGYTYDSAASVGGLPTGLCLPFDETRNITVADAVCRELRFHPKFSVRFDYQNYDPPLAEISDGDPACTGIDDGAVNVIARERHETAHPVVGVDIETVDVDTETRVDAETGIAVPMRTFGHQTAGDTASIDCLHVFLPLQPGSASTSWESLTVETEDYPTEDGTDEMKEWWIAKHPRLAGVDKSRIYDMSTSRTGDNGHVYAKITTCTKDALEGFGLAASIVRFKAVLTIKDADGEDVEQQLTLTMDFVTTSAHAGRHTRQTGSSSQAAETLPDGLAEAILAQRGGALESEDVEIRLGEQFPMIGSTFDGLVLQNFDVDLAGCTAQLHFGHPDYLSPEDMRDLLNGFRQRGYASNAPLRGTADPSEDAPAAPGGIQPLATTEFQPGVKQKAAVKAAVNNANAGKILLDATKVGDGAKMEVHTLTSGSASVKILSTDDIEVAGGGSSTAYSGTANVVTRLEFKNETDDHWLHAYTKPFTFANGLLTAVGDQESDNKIFDTTPHSEE